MVQRGLAPFVVPAALLVASTLFVSAQQAAPQPSPASAAPVDFARDIQPIFERHCYECHGPKKARGQLRLDHRARVFDGGMSGPAVIPGRADDSVLLRRVLGLDSEDRMPLDEEPLTDAEVGLIRRWIDQGAAWPVGTATHPPPAVPAKHWAYEAPVRPELPVVRNTAWPRTPIDRFVLARLEAEQLTPSAEASKETLLRRVALDLIGLPPTVADMDAFLADETPDAYERVVDRLLASPHYGERWARPWLDLARYADSNGYEKDRLRTMWRYRDWVIDALNRDMPFDQFTIEQIAGDMLPNASTPQRIATGFHRNTLLNQEGGIDVEEARFDTLVDRVNTTATVWLGSTVACAQCHNHKYDPFSQKDYYRLLAFFDNIQYTVGGQSGGDRWILEPQLELPTPEQAERRKALADELATVKARLASPGPEVDAGQPAWEQEMRAADAAWRTLRPAGTRAARGSILTAQPDGSVLASGPTPTNEVYTVEVSAPGGPITAIRLEALPDPSLPQGGPGRDYYGSFVLTGFTIETHIAGRKTALAFREAGADDAIWGQKPEDLLKPYEDGARTRDLPPGWAIDPTRDEVRLPRNAVFVLADPTDLPAGTPLTVTLAFRSSAVSQALGRFRLSASSDDRPLRVTTVKPKTRPVLLKAHADRTPAERLLITSLYRDQAPALAPLRERAAALQDAIDELGIVTALVMQEKPSHDRPSTPFRERGSFLSPGDRMYAATPTILPALGDDQMPNRLGLARWLVSPRNPLTARVTVNRAWEQFFGRGLVETSEDFGTQGAAPTHPELLDWLATELVAQKWSLKAVHRLIVTSATYRQSAAATPAMNERDPYNRLLARGPRFRMEAEMLRDAALSAAGLLSVRVGGPSVFPPQPDGIWDNPYSSERWVTSTGEDRYRRSLYTFTRRTSPYPSLMAFDATSREVCTVRRVRTNTPLQALTMLNDEAFFEAARALGGRMLDEVPGAEAPPPATRGDVSAPQGDGPGFESGGAAAIRARAAHGFRLVTSRRATDPEIDRIVAAYETLLISFRTRPADAARVAAAGPGEPAGTNVDPAVRAAWTMVANALLNLDEAVTR